MAIVKSDKHKNLLLVNNILDKGWIQKADSSHHLPSLNEVNTLIELCHQYIEIYSDKDIQDINLEIDASLIQSDSENINISPSKSQTGNIYLMKNYRNGFSKIGFTKNNPIFREKTLQSEEPEIELIRFWKGSLADEYKLHNIFKNKRLRGEWFDLTENDFNFIDNYFSISLEVSSD